MMGLAGAFPEQGCESGLLEIAVICERLGYAALFHHQEAGAVREAPWLVGPCGVALDGGMEPGVSQRNNLDARGIFKSLHHLGCESTAKLAHTGHEVECLDQDQLGRQDGNRRQRRADRQYLVMKAIGGVPQCYPVTGIREEDPLRSPSFGWPYR